MPVLNFPEHRRLLVPLTHTRIFCVGECPLVLTGKHKRQDEQYTP